MFYFSWVSLSSFVFSVLLFDNSSVDSYYLNQYKNANQLFKYKYLIKNEDPSQLIERIKAREVDQVVFSPKLNEVISIDKTIEHLVDKNTETHNDLIKEVQAATDTQTSTSTSASASTSTSTSLVVMEDDDLTNDGAVPLGECHYTKLNPFLTNKIVVESLDNGVKTVFLEKPIFSLESTAEFIGGLFNFGFPFLLLLMALQFFSSVRNIGGGGGGRGGNFPGTNGFIGNNFQMNKQKNNPQKPDSNPRSNNGFWGGLRNQNAQDQGFNPKKENISISSWSGSPEVFYECYEVISFLKNETLYREAGAELPRGVLLEGPPGTGKTLLAKAIASESDSNFISIVGSQFIELFVGVGALRVRQLFETARENRPCVIFIDEIDAVGKKRSVGGINTNDERENTLNELLSQMDGFNDNEGIVVIGATNLRDSLDPALLRPGRFDRIINVPLPDKNSRSDILFQYLKNKKIDVKSWTKNWGWRNETVTTMTTPTTTTMEQMNRTVSEISEYTGGFSGAELKNLINEAAIQAVRRGDTYIQRSDIENALEKLLVGIVKKTDDRSRELRRRVSLHELGHALIASKFPSYFDLNKISIQATYSGAGGYTLFGENQQESEGGLYTRDFLKKRIMVALGGKAAEEIFYGEDYVSLGATRDLEQANQLARNMIERFGMGNKELSTYYRSDMAGMGGVRSVSEQTQAMIDQEILTLVSSTYREVKDIVRSQYTKLSKIAEQLMIQRNMSGRQFQYLLKNLEDYYPPVSPP